MEATASEEGPALDATTYKITKNIIGGKDDNDILVGPDGKQTHDTTIATMYPAAGKTVYFRTCPEIGYTLSTFNVTLSGIFGAALEPVFGVYCPDEYNVQLPYVRIRVMDAGIKNIYIKHDASVYNKDEDGTLYGGRWAQNMRLATFAGEDLSAQCITPGSFDYVYLWTKDRGQVSYDKYSIVVFEFTYNGLNYQTSVSSYHQGTVTLLDRLVTS